jgi:flagellar protein FliS
MKQNTYLEAKVLTAPSQRLQLMLIEGALRFGRQAEQSLGQGETDSAGANLLRVIDIVGELSAGARQTKTELAQKIADVYRFIFLRVSQAKVNDDLAALQEALGLLEYERETWQMVCNQMEADSPAKQTTTPTAAVTPPPRPTIMPHLGAPQLGNTHLGTAPLGTTPLASPPSLGISLEA